MNVRWWRLRQSSTVGSVKARRGIISALLVAGIVLTPTAPRADVIAKDWSRGPFPRATIRIELGAHLGGRRGLGLGGAARWRRFIASVGVGPANGTSLAASMRATFGAAWFLSAMVDRVTFDGAAVTTTTSSRLAGGMVF
jgi:hypothetical protein